MLSNYKAALLKLEAAGTITCDSAKRPVRKGEKTMANHVKVTFPKPARKK